MLLALLWLALGAVACLASDHDLNETHVIVFHYTDETFPSLRAEQRFLTHVKHFAANRTMVQIREALHQRNQDLLVESIHRELSNIDSWTIDLYLSVGINGLCEVKKETPDSLYVCKGKDLNFTFGTMQKRIPFVSAGGGSSILPSSASPIYPSTELCPRGNLYGAYALLEVLGFNFLHPFSPVQATVFDYEQSYEYSLPLVRQLEPKWPIRQWHYHTQHPIELVDVLQGWGKTGMEDEVGFTEMLSEVEMLMEWLLANKQNRFQYALLAAESWAEFARSRRRQNRIKEITSLAHDFCIAIGVDAPIAFKQQHAFTLLEDASLSPANQFLQIKRNLDYLASTGIDFLGTENGLSEFTKPACSDMLRWINQTANYAYEAHSLQTSIKVHCSTGQSCPEYDNINFNFLPELATARMGVAPHTVQFYGLEDPAPGVYGNRDFSQVKKWMFKLMAQKDREVVFFGETEYWVSFDSPVPLFLPLYSKARLGDLRLIAKYESKSSLKMAGQSNFDSGFEWGSWFNSVITARSAYDTLEDIYDDNMALEAQIFQNIAKPMATTNSVAHTLVKALMNVIRVQFETMVLGDKANCNGKHGNCTAISYIIGYDMYSDSSTVFGAPTVSTLRIPMKDISQPSNKEYFENVVEPNLCLKLVDGLQRSLELMQPLRYFIKSRSYFLFQELLNAISVTKYRAIQVCALYNALIAKASNTRWSQHIQTAQEALQSAKRLIRQTERHYKVEEARLNSWSPNPTVYRYRYLWTVKKLYYWYRDESIAIQLLHGTKLISPCYRNMQNVLEELSQFKGITYVDHLTQLLRDSLHKVPIIHEITDCINGPSKEPSFDLTIM